MESDSASASETKPAGPPPNLQTSTAYPKRTNLYLKLILVGIIILISLQGYIMVRSLPWTLIPSGTNIPLVPNSSHALEFSLSQTSLVSGTIVATHGFVLYLVTSWQYDNATSKDNPTYHLLQEGPYFSVFTLQWGLPQGTFWIIFTNNGLQKTTVSIIQSINLSPY